MNIAICTDIRVSVCNWYQ